MADDKDFKSYSESGVDVNLGDRCSRVAYEACQKTFVGGRSDLLEPEKQEGGFAGPLRIISELKGGSVVLNSDGVGSKVLVAQRTGRHDTLGYDLVAMLADDAAAMGALPIAGTNTLDLHHAEPELVSQLMQGLVEACRVANISMVGGEIAELPDQVGGYSDPYIWNGELFGLLAEDKKIDGADIRAGQSIVGLRSNGIRANGLTLARRICRASFGEDWHEETFTEGKSWGEVLLKPARICTPTLVEAFGGYQGGARAEVTGIVHVTGGGLANLERVLPEGSGAVLSDPYPPGEELLRLQELGPVSDEEAYRTWNMGQCVLVITPEPEEVTSIAGEYSVPARVIGKIRRQEGIVCHGKGFFGEQFVL